MRNILNWIYLRIAPNRILRYISTPIQRRAFFVREFQEVYRRMWRGEFTQATLKDIREGIRREFDKTTEDLDATQIAFDNNSKKQSPNKEVGEALTKAIESKKKDIGQFKEQIDQLDKEIAQLDKLLSGYTDGIKLLRDFVNE